MGLFGFGKKKYAKNVGRDNEFLKDTAKVVHALTIAPVQPKAAPKKKGAAKKETAKKAA